MASITTWHRLTPISRSADFATAIAAEIHDPMWMLARQHQIGELRGEDTGSPAFVRIGYKVAPLVDLVLRSSPTKSVTAAFDPAKPIEAQMLPEPFAADLSMKVELTLAFFQMLADAFGARADAIRDRFLTVPSLALPAPDQAPFDPIDERTSAFALMTVGRTLDGVALQGLAQAKTIPAEFDGFLSADERDTLVKVYDAFLRWVAATFGSIGSTDPDGWNPSRLDYDVQLRFGAGAASVTLDVHPNLNGSVDWASFDLQPTTNKPFDALPVQVVREIPSHVRFPGMPAPRYWDFESGDLPWPDVDTTRTELARLLVIDFAMLYGVDMFVVPLELDVGNAVAIDSLLVYDVFGGRTIIDPVEAGRKPGAIPPDRFTMYTVGIPGGAVNNGDVANFMVLPPSAGGALQHGPVLEEVRFARDEVANMVWGIEAATQSRIGESRRGSERDSAVDPKFASAAAPSPTDAPLRYQLESRIPVHWIPFLLLETTGGAPTTELEKAASVRFDAAVPVGVPAVGKVLNPFGASGHHVFEEQVSRTGARVERLVFGARDRNGNSYLWVARRNRAGTGETQSGLRFDAALSTET